MTLLTTLLDQAPAVPTDSTAPVTNVLSVSASKISRAAGKDFINLFFTSDEAFTEYQVRVVPNPASKVTDGTLIEQGTVTGQIVRDNFTDTAGTLLENHVPDLGSGWTKHPSATQSAQISTGNRLRKSGSNMALYVNNTAPSSADYTVEADLYIAGTTDQYVGIIGRASATANTFYYARINLLSVPGYMRFTLARLVDGTQYIIGNWDDPDPAVEGMSRRLGLTMNGTTISLQVDGTTRISQGDSAITGPGLAGVRLGAPSTSPHSDDNGVHTENFIVTGTGTAWPANKQFGVMLNRAELMAGVTAEGSNTVKVFTKDAAGNWTGQSPPTYAATILETPDLASFWRLGESSGTTAADEKGAVPGTYTGNVTLGRPSLINTDSSNTAVGFYLTGTTVGYVDMGQNAYPFLGNAPFSVEGWFMFSTAPSTTASQFLISRMGVADTGQSGNKGWGLVANNGGFGLMRIHNLNFVDQRTGSAPVAGTLYHVVGTYDGSRTRVYVNGAKILDYADTLSVPSTASPFRLGTYGANTSITNGFRGTMDGVSVYNRALTDAEVAAHYARGTGT